MLYMCDVKLLEVFKWMWLMLDVMCVLCKMVRSVKMNGVKIKTVQKIQSNLLGAFGESCVYKFCKSFIKYLTLLKIMYNNFTNTLIYKHFHILNTSIILPQ